jgi:hypothetical protein
VRFTNEVDRGEQVKPAHRVRRWGWPFEGASASRACR